MNGEGRAEAIIAVIDSLIAELDQLLGEERDPEAFLPAFEVLSDIRSGVSDLGKLEGELAELHAELASSRARLTAAEKALHKANHDNDEWRQRLAKSEPAATAYPTHALYSRLVDSAEGDYTWVE